MASLSTMPQNAMSNVSNLQAETAVQVAQSGSYNQLLNKETATILIHLFVTFLSYTPLL